MSPILVGSRRYALGLALFAFASACTGTLGSGGHPPSDKRVPSFGVGAGLASEPLPGLLA